MYAQPWLVWFYFRSVQFDSLSLCCTFTSCGYPGVPTGECRYSYWSRPTEDFHVLRPIVVTTQGKGCLARSQTRTEWRRVFRCISTNTRPRRWEGLDNQIHAPATLPPLKKTRYPLHRTVCGPRDRFGWVRKISSLAEFEPRPASLHHSRYTVYSVPTVIRYTVLSVNTNDRLRVECLWFDSGQRQIFLATLSEVHQACTQRVAWVVSVMKQPKPHVGTGFRLVLGSQCLELFLHSPGIFYGMALNYARGRVWLYVRYSLAGLFLVFYFPVLSDKWLFFECHRLTTCIWQMRFL